MSPWWNSTRAPFTNILSLHSRCVEFPIVAYFHQQRRPEGTRRSHSFLHSACTKSLDFHHHHLLKRVRHTAKKKVQFLEAMKKSKARAKVYSSWTLNSKTEAPFAFILLSEAELLAVSTQQLETALFFFLFWLRPSSLVLSHTVWYLITINNLEIISLYFRF